MSLIFIRLIFVDFFKKIYQFALIYDLQTWRENARNRAKIWRILRQNTFKMSFNSLERSITVLDSVRHNFYTLE